VQIYPAIDLRGGRCVRLQQGDYSRETVFDDDPAAAARRWVEAGATWLHLVDLDGAREGRLINGESVRRIVESAGIPCQLGGGLRSEEAIQTALGWGVSRVVLGTRALKDPIWLESVVRKYPRQVALGIDAKQGKAATDGWLEDSGQSPLDIARRCSKWPLAAIIYTDITRDGMMEGPHFDALDAMARAVPLPVIASGGVTTAEDVRRLAALGLQGCIIGRALYEGRIDLAEIIQVATGVRGDGVRRVHPTG
jgi:phosphoribosylformimino-5-aminoimidazole carboxamide ribotide isomerase